MKDNQGKKKLDTKTKVISIISFFVCFAISKYVTQYVMAEYAVKESKSSPWDSKFKGEFMSACLSSAKQSLNRSLNPHEKTDSVVQGNLDKYVGAYCDCVVLKVEAEKIFPTKYNKLAQNRVEMEANLMAMVSAYTASEKGQETINHCAIKAHEVLAFNK